MLQSQATRSRDRSEKTGLAFRKEPQYLSGGQLFLLSKTLMDNDSFKFNTYTKVPNHLIEALLDYHFNATEHKIFLFIARLTYDWNKEKAFISYVSLSKRLKVDLRYIKRLVKRLKDEWVPLV
jgi:hypothetical protein